MTEESEQFIRWNYVPKNKPESQKDRTELEFKVCLHCGHLQNAGISCCDKCQAGKIGLGKPRELWMYLKLKIEGIISLPDAGYISTFKEELVTGILNADREKKQEAKDAKTEGQQTI